MTPFERSDVLTSLATTNYDLIVVGAGMTGAGVALDAASRGLRVALVDAGDFASGTSSKSSKLVHGGLRYLQQREFRLVYENLRERQRLLDNAPFLVRPLPFLIPLFGKNGVVAKTLVRGYATALRLYDLTGGWRIGQRYRRVTRGEALAHLPTLNTATLVAGFLYIDARGDDARVALTLARTAALDFGADAGNYIRVLEIIYGDDGRASAVRARDEIAQTTLTIRGRAIVNATGVWADQLFAMAQRPPAAHIKPAKGSHVSVSRDRLPADVAAVLNVPGERRSIFVVPFEDAPYTFIGTTDTAFDGDLDDPECSPEDVSYLLNAVNAATSSNLTADDVTGVWAGLRPLLAPRTGRAPSARTADLSRRHEVIDSHDGVVHITGGKWTTYRQMAEETVDALRPYFPDLAKVRTRNLRLHGTGSWRATTPLGQRLYERYGEDAQRVLELIDDDASLAECPITNQPYTKAEFVYAVRFEMATSLIDVLTRRTRAHLHDSRATLAAAETIAHLLGDNLRWSPEQIELEIKAYRDLVVREFTAAGLEL